jgi:aerobic carbon-monoxide dehydrogenase medium subunit
MLMKYGDEAKILSGGHSLIPMMKLRFASPETLIDINGIPDLSHIKEDGGTMKIGGLAREADLEHSALLLKTFPIFAYVTKLIADPQVRNRGKIGGNLAHGDAANDHPAVMLALNASVVATGPEGARTIPIDEFFFGFYMTALQHGDILTEIQIPIPPKRTGSAYHKMERKVGDYTTAGVAVQITLDDDGECTAAGIGLTNVNPTPLRASRSEQALIGKKLTDDVIKKAFLVKNLMKWFMQKEALNQERDYIKLGLTKCMLKLSTISKYLGNLMANFRVLKRISITIHL